MLPIGTRVRSTWGHLEQGDIVGYGAICWPTGPNMNGDAGVMQAVYLVQVAEGSGYQRAACIVLRADRVEEV